MIKLPIAISPLLGLFRIDLSISSARISLFIYDVEVFFEFILMVLGKRLPFPSFWILLEVVLALGESY